MRRATSKILGKVPKRSSPTSAPAERPKSDCTNKQTDKYGASMTATSQAGGDITTRLMKMQIALSRIEVRKDSNFELGFLFPTTQV
jgi:hypothetical protein